MKNGVYYIGVDTGTHGDFSSMVVMKRIGIREVEILDDVLIRIRSLEDSKRFESEVEKMKEKYNAKILGNAFLQR